METIVEQIHKEFNQAQDKILLQCPNASAEALHNMGFYKSRSAAEFDPDFYYTKECAQYFRAKYPQHKFISEKQVETICRKYNLVLAEVRYYIGTVPHSKVAEIVSFRIARGDLKWRSVNTYGSVEKHPINHYDYSGGGGTLKDKKEMVQGEQLWICAPASDIDGEGLTQVGHNLLEHVRVDDPVVLQPVEGGFLIVAAWGPEASDELVVNEKMN